MFMSFFNLLGYLYFFALHISSAGSFPKPLSKEDEMKYLEIMNSNDFSDIERKDAKDKLISHNLRLVAHVIKKYYSNYSDQDDLISIGTIGLIKGINSFDASKGAKLATYAARCIENEILMYFRSKKNKDQYILLGEPIDLDSEGNPLTVMDVVCDDLNLAENVEMKLKTEQALKFVEEIEDEREKKIIIMRYGLNNHAAKTQREVANELGISRSYVSRIEKKVLESIRSRFEKS